MDKTANRTCLWCGKWFYGAGATRYCSKECCKSVKAAIKKARRAGIRLSADGAILKHHEEMMKNRPTKGRMILKPVHVSSNSMIWTWRKEI